VLHGKIKTMPTKQAQKLPNPIPVQHPWRQLQVSTFPGLGNASSSSSLRNGIRVRFNHRHVHTSAYEQVLCYVESPLELWYSTDVISCLHRAMIQPGFASGERHITKCFVSNDLGAIEIEEN
jgi:hypothetical protein